MAAPKSSGMTGPVTYVCAYPGNFDFVNAERGFPNCIVLVGAPATYFEFTAGLNITPTIPSSIPFIKSVIFRPEVRYDTTLNSVRRRSTRRLHSGISERRPTWSRSAATSS